MKPKSLGRPFLGCVVIACPPTRCSREIKAKTSILFHPSPWGVGEEAPSLHRCGELVKSMSSCLGGSQPRSLHLLPSHQPLSAAAMVVNHLQTVSPASGLTLIMKALLWDWELFGCLAGSALNEWVSLLCWERCLVFNSFWWRAELQIPEKVPSSSLFKCH